MNNKPSTYDVAVLMKKLERATSINDLNLYAEEAKTAPEVDKPLLRAMYAARLKQLRTSPAPSQSSDDSLKGASQGKPQGVGDNGDLI